MSRSSCRCVCLGLLCGAIGFAASAAEPLLSLADSNTEPAVGLVSSRPGLWQGGVGEGFQGGTHSVGLSLGAGYGLRSLGSREHHHFALASLSYGYMLSSVVGEGHWYRGNLEVRAELFGGAQFSPNSDWIIGLTPHLRYNFATGSRWMPFIDGGAGVTATGIGRPDLSGTFEFNLQACVGVHRFLRDDLALTFEVRFLHLSCAGINQPNLGANDVMGFVGLTKFF